MRDMTNSIHNSDSAYALSPSLTSLIILDCALSTNELELLFSVSPTLLHLKLHSAKKVLDSMFDGYYWERLIRTTLRSLKKFEIFFSYGPIDEDNTVRLRSLIVPFQTPF